MRIILVIVGGGRNKKDIYEVSQLNIDCQKWTEIVQYCSEAFERRRQTEKLSAYYYLATYDKKKPRLLNARNCYLITFKWLFVAEQCLFLVHCKKANAFVHKRTETREEYLLANNKSAW